MSGKIDFKKLLIDIIFDAISGLLVGIALYNFAADAKFPLTGVSGIAMIFYQFFGFKIGIVTIILNIPIVLISYRILGRKFMFRSFKTMIIGSVIMDYVTPLIPKVQLDNELLTAVVVAILTGISYAIIYMRKSSTGGADFIIMTIKAKRPHMSLGRIFFLVDVAVILLDTVCYSPSIESMCYGLIISYLASLVVDKMMLSADSGKMAMIVTNKAQQMADAITEGVDRGSTIFTAKGGYTGQDRQVLMCACSNKQMYEISRMVKTIDVDAFIVILESHEIYGEGFKRFK
ncbi:MAG: YitT family protein [Pseudobutyrivibrio sp.]|nr:YitT family protein [Pseudobutyrivibrio sp.]